MAYDEFLAERISQYFTTRKVNYNAKKMMGGLCFMVDDKMCCGIHYDKKKQTDLLMARIGEEAYQETTENPYTLPMDFTGRAMKGYIFVTPEGFDSEEDLTYWLDLCMAFNPRAKSSRKKK